MFEGLSDRFSASLQKIRGKGRLSESNIRTVLKDVRMALLESDVALPVVKKFIERVRVRAIGREVMKSLSPSQAFIKIVKDELTTTMGKACEELALDAKPPVVVLVAGLQGSGKTTTMAKLAKWLTEKQKKKVMLVSVDVYRPAAMTQLRTLAKLVDVTYFEASADEKPVNIAKSALEQAKKQFFDVVLVDTAGRLHIDEEMMAEIKDLHQALDPTETLFVVDSMMGQDAANVALAFSEALPLTGVILTKTDGDARGGAALSVRTITGKPIKFIGTGEKVDALQPFHPDRIASRILGMGDVMSLIEEAEHKLDHEKAEKFAKKIQKGKGFDLEDFRGQLQEMKKFGGIANMMEKLPGMGKMAAGAEAVMGDQMMVKMEAMIGSMTPQEKRKPDCINGSRRRRIAMGAGTEVQDVNRLLKQFEQMQKMMKKMSKKGIRGMMKSLPKGMLQGGGMPPLG